MSFWKNAKNLVQIPSPFVFPISMFVIREDISLLSVASFWIVLIMFSSYVVFASKSAFKSAKSRKNPQPAVLPTTDCSSCSPTIS